VSFENGGQIVNFKPMNIEGFEDVISLDRNHVMKYFEVGDAVKVIEGKYQYETGIVMSVDEENATMPTVKLDSTHREI
jgi:transcription elongation factor